MPSRYIKRSARTYSHTKERLKESLGPNAILQSVDAEKIGIGQGFLSHILKVKLHWENDEGLPKTVIVKVASSENIDKLIEEASSEDEKKIHEKTKEESFSALHKTECNLYQLFERSPPCQIPKCYVAFHGDKDAPGILVLEDLSEEATVIPSLIDGFTLPQILEAVEALARLHGWSMITDLDWRQHVEEITARLSRSRPLAVTLSAWRTVMEMFPETFGGVDLDFVARHMSIDAVTEVAVSHRQYMDDVLTHGDTGWAYNFLYEKRPDGTIGDHLIALIDFQTAVRAAPMPDLGRFMIWYVKSQIRKDHIKTILRHYHGTLRSVVGDELTPSLEHLPIALKVMVKSEGEQKKRVEQVYIDRMKAAYDDSLEILRQ